MINFNVLKRWVSILSLAVCLFGNFDSAAQVRYIPVDDFSDLNPGQVFVIGSPDKDIVATYQKDDKFLSAPASHTENGYLVPGDEDEVMLLVLSNADYKDGIGNHVWQFTISKYIPEENRYVDYDFLAYNSSSLVHLNDSNLDSKYAASLENAEDGSTLISFVQPASDTQTAYIRFVDTDSGYKDSGYKLVCTDDLKNSHPVKLYRKDVYDLYVVNPKPVWTKGDTVQVHINVYHDTDKYKDTYYYYIFSNELNYPTMNEIYGEMKKIGIKSGNQSDYADSGILELEMEYPGGDITLWFQVSQDGGRYDKSDCMNYRFIESKGPTSISGGHFSHPDVDRVFELNEEVKFTKDSDVKIYYTLDGQDPVIGNVEMPLSRAEVEEEETDGSSDEHAGKTYDLDARPIVYTGTPLNIRYIAVKDGYSPSEVMDLNVSGVTSVIASIETDNEAGKAQYFDLSGRQVTSPAVPGVYIRTLGGKTDKVMVR